MNSVCISGATGSIGMALIKNCIEKGTEVYILLRKDSNRRDRIEKLMAESNLVHIIDAELSDFAKMCESDSVNITSRTTKISDPLQLSEAEPTCATSPMTESESSLTASSSPASESSLTALSSLSIDAFYHFAWAGTFGDSRNNMELQAQNEKYALDAVRLAHEMGAKVFIGAGSQAEYGRVEGLLKPDLDTNPENGYGIYKLEAGKSTRELALSLGMNHVWTRILSVYGPYDGKDTMIMSTIAKLLRREKPSLTKGEQIWDYLYSDDAAEAMYLIGENFSGNHHGADDQTGTATAVTAADLTIQNKTSGMSIETGTATAVPPKSDLFVIGSGEGRPLREYMEIMRDAVDPSLTLGIGEIPYGPKQVMHLQADISSLKDKTGFVPKTGFEEGIRRTICFVRDNYL